MFSFEEGGNGFFKMNGIHRFPVAYDLDSQGANGIADQCDQLLRGLQGGQRGRKSKKSISGAHRINDIRGQGRSGKPPPESNSKPRVRRG